MKKVLVAAAAALVTCALMQCTQPMDDEPDETTVSFLNDLIDITIDTNIVVDSVHIYGLSLGSDIDVSVLAAGVSTSDYTTDDYGSYIEFTADSLVVVRSVCDNLGCAQQKVTVRDVGAYFVAVDRHESNRLIIDESLIPVDQLFGATRVRVVNRMASVRVSSSGSSSQDCDTLNLYGVTISTTNFDQVFVGDTTQYDEIDDAGDVDITIDSAVGTIDVLGNPTRVVWDSIPAVTRRIDALVSNTIVFDRSSSDLLSNLGPATLR